MTDFTCGVAAGTDLAVCRAVRRAVVREDGIEITTHNPLEGSRETKLYKITVDQYCDWVNGALIQNAMPELPEDDRELLITGMVW